MDQNDVDALQAADSLDNIFDDQHKVENTPSKKQIADDLLDELDSGRQREEGKNTAREDQERAAQFSSPYADPNQPIINSTQNKDSEATDNQMQKTPNSLANRGVSFKEMKSTFEMYRQRTEIILTDEAETDNEDKDKSQVEGPPSKWDQMTAKMPQVSGYIKSFYSR